VWWEPRDRLVFFEHLLALTIDIHKPTRVSTVHELCATTVTVWVAVLDVVDLPDDSAFLEIFCDLLVYFPDIMSLPVTFCEEPILVDGMDRRKSFFFGELKVFFTICR